MVPGGSVPHLQGALRRDEDSPTPPDSHLPFPPSDSADSIKPGVRSIERDLDHPSLGSVPDPSSPSGVLLLVHSSSRSVSRVGSLGASLGGRFEQLLEHPPGSGDPEGS